MIIPTSEYDPMFADDNVPFRDKMIDYIRREFPVLLQAHVTQLSTDQDLEELSRSINGCSAERSQRDNIAA